ncbi:hypothetical protein KC614_02615 [candidate division WWE3 bacterium]|uniref:Uncharacterized protein n=1 Tax=candidate division WWE3 bacterium TaxID=2053526 RepID=A0A955LJV6_UNCKA|nr:hypothetical protein [candidate division WWE3 bacterium]
MLKLKSQKGSVVEFVLLGVMVVLLVGAVYFYAKGNKQVVTNVSPTPVAFESDDLSPTPLPSIAELNTNSGDSSLDATANDLNTLVKEMDSLDKMDDDLSLPEVDFSVNF